MYKENFDYLFRKTLNSKRYYSLTAEDKTDIINDTFLKVGVDAARPLLVWKCKLMAIDWMRKNGYKSRNGIERPRESSLDSFLEKYGVHEDDCKEFAIHPRMMDYSGYNFPYLIAQLPEDEQTIIYEMFVNNRSFYAISIQLKKSQITIERHYRHALEKLRGLIENKPAAPQTKKTNNARTAPNPSVKKAVFHSRRINVRYGTDGRRFMRRSHKHNQATTSVDNG